MIDKLENKTVEFTASRHSVSTCGDWIRQKRLEMGLNQVELAMRIEVNDMTIVGWDSKGEWRSLGTTITHPAKSIHPNAN